MAKNEAGTKPPKTRRETPRARKAREWKERIQARAARVSEDRADQADPAREHIPVKVRVKDGCMGYYGHKRRRAGDVFVCLDSEYEFSERWMEEVGNDTPDSITTGQDVLEKQREDLRARRVPTGSVDAI